VFNSESCTTFAVDARTGRVKWAWWLGDPQTSAPSIAGNLAFASYPVPYDGPSGATHALAAFDLATGKAAWTRWLDGDVMSAPVAAGEFLYVTTFAGSVLKLEQQTGELRYAVAMKATSAPVVVPGKNGHESLFVTRRAEERPEETKEAIVRAELGDTRLTYRVHTKLAPYLDDQIQKKTQYAKDGHGDDTQNGFDITPPAAGAGIAKDVVGVDSISTMQRFQGSRVLVAGDFVFSTLGDEVVAIDAATGESKWRYPLAGNAKQIGGHLGTAPLLAGTDIIVATVGGDVLRLAARTGQLVATYHTSAPLRSQPIVVDGWIYLGTDDGRLIAINTGDKALTGWPAWGGDAGRSSVRTL
jgi:outer membrane protein assembly factor BamB